jgi:endonuclease/exonuclease/phosphatase family metal-dependent hydrolase
MVFLQEVQGLHERPRRAPRDWPEQPQHEFLAEGVWPHTAYGGNAIYDHGHHGNAILSRFPILASHNQDISEHRFERRGLLHTEIAVPGWRHAGALRLRAPRPHRRGAPAPDGSAGRTHGRSLSRPTRR